MLLAILAQAQAPVVVDYGIAFALPVVVLIGGLTAALVETRLRVTQAEKDRDELKVRVATLEKSQAATEAKVGTQTEIMTRVESTLQDMRRESHELRQEIHTALRKSA